MPDIDVKGHILCACGLLVVHRARESSVQREELGIHPQFKGRSWVSLDLSARLVIVQHLAQLLLILFSIDYHRGITFVSWQYNQLMIVFEGADGSVFLGGDVARWPFCFPQEVDHP